MNPINIKRNLRPVLFFSCFWYVRQINEINLWTKIIVFCCLLASIKQYLTYSIALAFNLDFKHQMRWWRWRWHSFEWVIWITCTVFAIFITHWQTLKLSKCGSGFPGEVTTSITGKQDKSKIPKILINYKSYVNHFSFSPSSCRNRGDLLACQ